MRPYSFILLSSFFSLLPAQEHITLDKIEVQENYTTIEERRDNAISKRIIKAEELAQYGDMNAMELLKRTPGVTISDGRKKGAVGKGYTQVLVDGEVVVVSSRRRPSPLEQISPDMIERIEVISNGSAEHSAEAMWGIVNIILKKPKSDGHVTAKVSGGFYSDFPMGSLFAQYEKKSDQIGYSINATYSDSKKGDNSVVDEDRLGIMSYQDSDEESRSRSFGLNVKAIHKPNSQSGYTFDLAFGGNEDNSNVDETIRSLGALTKDIHQADESDGIFYMLKILGEHHVWQTMMVDWKLIAHERKSSGERSSYESIGGDEILQNDESAFGVFGGNANLSYALGSHFLKSGVEYRHQTQDDDVRTYENGVNTTIPSDNVSMDQDKYAIYLQDEVDIGERVVVTLGLRYEAIDRDYGSVQTLDYWAPSLHFLYRFSEHDIVRASVAKTVKLPRLDEIATSIDSSLDGNDINNPDITGNPNLTEESALSYELRLEHYFEDKGIVSLNAFYRDIDDKIEKLTTVEAGRYVKKPYNTGEGKLWGVELEIKKPLTHLIDGLGMWGNLTLQNSTLHNTQNGFNGVIGETPDYLLNIGLDHTYAPYHLSYGVAYRYNGGYDDLINQSQIEKSQKGYGVLDMYVSKRLDSTFKVTMNLKNLTTDMIETTSKQYNNNVLEVTQNDFEHSQPQILLTLEGKW